MFEKKAHKISDERLDRAGLVVVRSAASGDAEADTVAASPFLYTRIAARIEERRREQRDEGWLALIAVAWRAVPAMAFVAALALALMLWFGINGASGGTQLSDEAALVGAQGTGPVSVVLSDNGQLSHDDVFELVVDREVTRSNR